MNQKYHLAPWSKVLENLIVRQLVKKSPALYGSRRFSTVFTTPHHWPLPEPDESSHALPSYFPKIRSNIIFP
jgi:hypothetical protein